MDQIPKRRRRNISHAKEDRKLGEKSNGSAEIIRLEMKKKIYSVQEKVLKKIRRVVSEQMVRVEVEGLQLAANIREKELEEFGASFDEANAPVKVVRVEEPSLDPTDLDDVKEINKNELDLDTDLGAFLYNDYCPAAEEEEDDVEDELEFQYLQEFKTEDPFLEPQEL